MTKFWNVLLLCCILATPAAAQDLYPSSKHVLDNGMPVVITEMEGNPMVSVYCLVKTGSATEGRFLGAGISHFVEHMLFKTTKKRKVGQIAREVQAMGGEINATTSQDFTIYTITVPADKFAQALDVLVDQVSEATFDPAEVEKERTVIFREMDLHWDNPESRLGRLAFENLFLKHPYRYPTIGYKELFASITRDELYAYYKEKYVPNNMVLSVAGGVRAKDIMPQIKTALKDFKRGYYPERLLEQEPPQVTPRYREEKFGTPYTYLSMAYQGVSLLDKDLYALDVLAQILGQGKTSRLYKDLYLKRQIVYGVHVYNFTPIDKGAFEVETQLEGKDLDKVKNIVLDHIHRIQEKGVSSQELAIAKEQVRAGYVFDHQHSSSIAWSQAMDEAFTGNYKFSQKYVDEIAKVTPKDIQRVAKAYLRDGALCVSVLKPKGEAVKKEASPEKMEKSVTHKYVLDNGLTILLRPKKNFPMVSIRLNMEGGSRQEPAELQGISNQTAADWVKGTQKMDFDAISELTESSGIQLGVSSGRNSLGLTVDTLPEHLDTSLDLLKGLVFTPTFPDRFLKQDIENTKQSLKQRDQTPFSLTRFKLNKLLFPTHPFGRDPAGTEASLSHIQRADVVKFYHKFLSPEHMVLSVVGNFNETKLLARLKKDYGALPKNNVTIKKFTEKPIAQPRFEKNTLDKEQAIVMFGFQGPTIYAKDYYQAEVTGAILGSSFSGRMFRHIRDKLSKAYTLGGGFSGSVDAGMFTFYISTTKDNVQTVIDLFRKEVEDMRNNPVTDKELQDIKTYLKGIHKSGMQTDYQVNMTINFDELYGLGYDHYLNFDKNIDGVTKTEVQATAQKYWDLDRMVTVVTSPDNKKSADE